MHDVMLFGEGWNGEVRQVEEGVQRFPYIPQINDPNLREVVFSIFGFQSENGHSYCIGWAGGEPLLPDIEHAIRIYNPSPSMRVCLI